MRLNDSEDFFQPWDLGNLVKILLKCCISRIKIRGSLDLEKDPKTFSGKEQVKTIG